MEIESLSRRQSSLSLDPALSVSPPSSPPPTSLGSLSRSRGSRCEQHGVAMTTIVPHSLPPPPSLHLLGLPSASSTYSLVKLQHSASTNQPFPLSCPRLQRHRPRPPLSHPTTDPATPPCVPHLSNDLLLMLYQLTLQTGPLSHPPLSFSHLLSLARRAISYPLRSVFPRFAPSSSPSPPFFFPSLSLSSRCWSVNQPA